LLINIVSYIYTDVCHVHPSGQGHRKNTTVKAKAYSEGYVLDRTPKKGEMHCFGELCIPYLKCYSRSETYANIHINTTFITFVDSFTKASNYFLVFCSFFCTYSFCYQNLLGGLNLQRKALPREWLICLMVNK
jgi:hypothetical protein